MLIFLLHYSVFHSFVLIASRYANICKYLSKVHFVTIEQWRFLTASHTLHWLEQYEKCRQKQIKWHISNTVAGKKPTWNRMQSYRCVFYCCSIMSNKNRHILNWYTFVYQAVYFFDLSHGCKAILKNLLKQIFVCVYQFVLHIFNVDFCSTIVW